LSLGGVEEYGMALGRELLAAGMHGRGTPALGEGAGWERWLGWGIFWAPWLGAEGQGALAIVLPARRGSAGKKKKWSREGTEAEGKLQGVAPWGGVELERRPWRRVGRRGSRRPGEVAGPGT
jgi:hypothetical protein